MLRLAVRLLVAGVLCLFVTASTRGHLQAAGQFRPDGPAVATAGQLIISEFRLRGPNGAQDEFIEIYNHSFADHTVAALSGTGYGVAASDGVTRCTIPNGTIIPDRGHYLCVNSAGYSLSSYPAGSGTTATGDATYTLDIPDDAGIAIFNNNTGGASYSLVNRLDAVGSTIEANTLYREGGGYPAIAPLSVDHSFTRHVPGGCIGTTFVSCDTALLMQTTLPVGRGLLVDTNDNAIDFIYVDTNGTAAGAGQRLGAPGPENLSSPIALGFFPAFPSTWLDPCVPPLSAVNKVRTYTSEPFNNSTFGTYEIRRTWTNNTGFSLTRLRFRILDVSTFPAPSGVADFRPRSSSDISIGFTRPPCDSGISGTMVRGTTVEQPPSQPNGSGYNGTLSVGAVTSSTPLANGAPIDVRFLFHHGVHGCLGRVRFHVGAWRLRRRRPGGPRALSALDGLLVRAEVVGELHDDARHQLRRDGLCAVPGDFDGDGKNDLAVYQLSSARLTVVTSSSGYDFNSPIVRSAVAGDVPITSAIVTPNSRELNGGDADGDFASDLTVFNTTSGVWSTLTSTGGFVTQTDITWGVAGETPVSGDFDGDGRRDLGRYDPSTGQWRVLLSSTDFATTLMAVAGGAGPVPVAGDYDGDGKTDPVAYNTTTGLWFGLKSSTNYTTTLSMTWGGAGYTAAPGDFDGDGKQDLAIYNTSTGAWSVLMSTSGYLSSITRNFGGVGYVPIPADFDGDGFTDFAVYQPSTGLWTMLKSSSGNTLVASIPYGGAGYTPVAGDWDGDRRADIGVYGASGAWSILLSTANYAASLGRTLGGAGYVPVPVYP